MAYESQIGTYHLGENPQLYSPQRANNYEFVSGSVNVPISVPLNSMALVIAD